MNHRHLLVLPLAAVLCVTILGCGNGDGATASNGPRDRLHGKRDENGGSKESFETARKDPPVKPETSFAAASYNEQLGQLPKAAELYRQTLKSDPKHQHAMYRLGVVTAKLRQFPESIDVWQRYVKLTNGSSEAYSNLAYTQDLAGLRTEAQASYETGISRDPKNVPCRVNYGILLAKQGKTADALTQLEAVLSPAEAHYNIGSVYELQGKTEEARAEYKTALDLDANLVDARTRLAALDRPGAAGVSRAD